MWSYTVACEAESVATGKAESIATEPQKCSVKQNDACSVLSVHHAE